MHAHWYLLPRSPSHLYFGVGIVGSTRYIAGSPGAPSTASFAAPVSPGPHDAPRAHLQRVPSIAWLLETHSIYTVCASSIRKRSEAFSESVRLQVSELKDALKTHRLQFPSRASKAQLAKLLIESSVKQRTAPPEHRSNGSGDGAGATQAQDSKKPRQETKEGTVAIVPGTKNLQVIATAAAAAQEKVQAGENRAVEHVALGDTDVAGNLL